MQPQIQYAAGLSLILTGIALTFFCLDRLFKTFKFRYLVLPLPVLAIGIGLIEWRALLLLALFAACLCWYIRGFHAREENYAREFPVFSAAPVGSVRGKDGFKHDLHIAEVGAGFIIGIQYETEVDLNPATIQTRWKDVFPDHASAKEELMQRLAGFIPAERMPDDEGAACQ